MIAVAQRFRKRRVTALAAFTAGAALATSLFVATPAYAADEVQLSPDGTSFSSTYPGTLFGNIARYVPGDTDQETFFVRNGGPTPGHLRVTLTDTMSSDTDFADAFTVSASTVNQPGSTASLLSASPCWVLLEGVVLGVGETVAVTTDVALGDLHGLAGQGASAEFSIGVALYGSAVSLPPTHCGAVNVTVPGTTQPPRPGAPGQQGSAPLLPGADPEIPTGGGGPSDLPVLNLPELLGIDPNTWQLFEEYFVLVLIGAFIVGTAWFGFVAWHRRKNETEPDTEGAAG
jgi:hypothetical protein